MNQYLARSSYSSGSRSSYSSSRSYSSRSSSPSRSSSTKSSSSKSTTSKSSTAKSKTSSASKVSGKSTAKPGSTIKTASGKTIKSSTAKPTNLKSAHSTGIVGDNGYTPRFSGYSAPPGSVVYYPQSSALDYLPWIYLFSQHSPHDQQATVVQPDGKQVTAQPQRGVDGMYIFNWIILILILVAVCVGIIWGINKITKNKGLKPHAAY